MGKKVSKSKAVDETDLYNKVVHLIRNNNFSDELKEEISEFINSDFVDVADDEDGYVFSRVILCRALRQLVCKNYPYVCSNEIYNKVLKVKHIKLIILDEKTNQITFFNGDKKDTYTEEKALEILKNEDNIIMCKYETIEILAYMWNKIKEEFIDDVSIVGQHKNVKNK